MKRICMVAVLLAAIFPCSFKAAVSEERIVISIDENLYKKERKAAMRKAAETAEKYRNETPLSWGTDISGIMYKFKTDKKEVAITLDACGGKKGSGADIKLIDFLIANEIKTTVFVNIRWIEANRDMFEKIVSNSIFEIENHGIEHRPLSVTERNVYTIDGTNSAEKTAYEAEAAGLIIETYSGRKPIFFRSGTAYYDDIAVKILKSLGYTAAGFSLNADYGASIPKKDIENNIKNAEKGDIIIGHINRPKSETGVGIANGLKALKEKGFVFMHLSEVEPIYK